VSGVQRFGVREASQHLLAESRVHQTVVAFHEGVETVTASSLRLTKEDGFGG
jgi:hypothetical protein